MTFDPYADRFSFTDPNLLLHPSSASTTPSVKSEPSSSPHSDSPLHTFSFSYPLHSPAPLDKPDHPPLPYHPIPHDRPFFRFGMAHHSPDSWSLKRPQHDPPHPANIALDLNAIPFHDDYDDADDFGDLPPTSGPASHAGQSDRIVRRRSSKGRFHPLPSVESHSDSPHSPLFQHAISAEKANASASEPLMVVTPARVASCLAHVSQSSPSLLFIIADRCNRNRSSCSDSVPLSFVILPSIQFLSISCRPYRHTTHTLDAPT